MDAVMTCLRRTLLSSPKQRGVSYPIRYSTLFWLFMLGSVAGFVLEGLWCVLCKGHWEHHSATVWGPFCLIYGIGAVAVYLLSVVLKSKNLLVQFGVFTVYGAAVEYFGSLFQELCFGSVSWDYSEHMLNLGGRVSLKMAFMWGGAGYCVYAVCLPLDQPPVGKDEGNGLADCLCGNDGLYGREPAGHFRRDYPVENTGGWRACQQSSCPMAGRYLRR